MIYFFPHSYLRDRQLSTIREWSRAEVVNPDLASNTRGAQVSKSVAIGNKNKRSWKQMLPLLNIKLRPKQAPNNSVVYVWGGLIANGSFIVDIDNPWSLVGYNVSAMSIYNHVIKKILLSQRCIEIRCMSRACRISLQQLFGDDVYHKAKLHYPVAGIDSISIPSQVKNSKKVRLLFIGSQFEIKGGRALIEAYKYAKKVVPNISLRIVTHLPNNYKDTVDGLGDVKVFPPDFSRKEIFEMMQNSDILIHPSYMESFGMTILEGMANGLCIIANNIYAISEMVLDGNNGVLLRPPITKWNGTLPNENFMKKSEFLDDIRKLDINEYVEKLSNTIVDLSNNQKKLSNMKLESLKRFVEIRKANGE
jgi:glycosyltransferase involved in cell wall biosynthesis